MTHLKRNGSSSSQHFFQMVKALQFVPHFLVLLLNCSILQLALCKDNTGRGFLNRARRCCLSSYLPDFFAAIMYCICFKPTAVMIRYKVNVLSKLRPAIETLFSVLYLRPRPHAFWRRVYSTNIAKWGIWLSRFIFEELRRLHRMVV